MNHPDTSLVASGDIYIGGEWRKGRGNQYASIYPADQSVNAEISTADADDAREAVEIADRAYRQADCRTEAASACCGSASHRESDRSAS